MGAEGRQECVCLCKHIKCCLDTSGGRVWAFCFVCLLPVLVCRCACVYACVLCVNLRERHAHSHTGPSNLMRKTHSQHTNPSNLLRPHPTHIHTHTFVGLGFVFNFNENWPYPGYPVLFWECSGLSWAPPTPQTFSLGSLRTTLEILLKYF